MAVLPAQLPPNGTIGVFAPSSWVERDDIEKSKALLEQRGYKVFIHPQTYERENQSAGTILQKVLAFQGLWQRKDIDVIWAAGGGNRCTHLLESINFNRLNQTQPKPVIGFSDATALLNALYANNDIITFHGPVFKNLHAYQQTDHLFGLLSGEKANYPVTQDNVLCEGKTQGHLIGGNLSVFQYLPQTLPNDIHQNAVLFLEDCNEELSRIDRMFLHLKRTGTLSAINGLLIGQFTNMPESGKPFGYSLKDIIQEHTDGLDIPILYDLPFGHGADLYTFPIGAEIEIDTQTNSLSLTQGVCA
ncbi:MAG: S66 peptidase family protein [Alphaproteobacteria bacterium]